ncbi:MAG: class I SAM-dependent methyltransferase [Methanomassiliicoccales archaeon]|nr:MAG: class I SAM-dependent methyltransferase [Methanomassiliicoccales archaeon]
MKTCDCEDIYWDGRHYDKKYQDLAEDIPFYLRQVEKYGEPVLELACGTGRVTIPIAEKGFDITGLDISEPMLALAKEKAAERKVDVKWILADYRDFKLDTKFNLIIIPFNSMAHILDLESLNACFSRVKEHLTASGRFIVDYFNPRLDFLLRDPSSRRLIKEYPDPDGKGIVVIYETNVYDAVTQINRIKWYYKIGDEGKEWIKELNMRIYYPQELDELLLLNGFKIEVKYGNFDETPFESQSPKQLIVCRKS